MEDEFYDKFLSKKEENKGERRWTWPVIGGIVEKEQGTVRLAFKNKSLTSLEKKALYKEYLSNGLLSKEKPKKVELSDFSDLEILDYVYKNRDRMKDLSLYEVVTKSIDVARLKEKVKELEDKLMSLLQRK